MDKEHLEIIPEDIRGKFELVLEGHEALHQEIRDTRQELGEKISLVDFKVDALSERVDSIAEDLKAHRADTEAHRPIYRVKE
jgi:hypothetical protein